MQKICLYLCKCILERGTFSLELSLYARLEPRLEKGSWNDGEYEIILARQLLRPHLQLGHFDVQHL